jgi:hypothetical protein
MFYFEKLTLSLLVCVRNSFIDGIYLDASILSRMLHLHTFYFDIVTEYSTFNDQFTLSPDVIRRRFMLIATSTLIIV